MAERNTAAMFDRVISPLPKNSGYSIGNRGLGNLFHPVHHFVTGHAGQDMPAPQGTPILAPTSGIIGEMRTRGGYGNFTQLMGDSFYNFAFGHQIAFARGLKAGDRVVQGQIIGYVGSTGISTGNHLHFEVLDRFTGERLDPKIVLYGPDQSKWPDQDQVAREQRPAYVQSQITVEQANAIMARKTTASAIFKGEDAEKAQQLVKDAGFDSEGGHEKLAETIKYLKLQGPPPAGTKIPDKTSIATAQALLRVQGAHNGLVDGINGKVTRASITTLEKQHEGKDEAAIAEALLQSNTEIALKSAQERTLLASKTATEPKFTARTGEPVLRPPGNIPHPGPRASTKNAAVAPATKQPATPQTPAAIRAANLRLAKEAFPPTLEGQANLTRAHAQALQFGEQANDDLATATATPQHMRAYQGLLSLQGLTPGNSGVMDQKTKEAALKLQEKLRAPIPETAQKMFADLHHLPTRTNIAAASTARSVSAQATSPTRASVATPAAPDGSFANRWSNMYGANPPSDAPPPVTPQAQEAAHQELEHTGSITRPAPAVTGRRGEDTSIRQARLIARGQAYKLELNETGRKNVQANLLKKAQELGITDPKVSEEGGPDGIIGDRTKRLAKDIVKQVGQEKPSSTASAARTRTSPRKQQKPPPNPVALFRGLVGVAH